MGWSDLTELQEKEHAIQRRENLLNNVQLEEAWHRFVDVCDIYFCINLEGK